MTSNNVSHNEIKLTSSATLMVQGTTSDAGKSILVTALCRILARHKISVAPFKPQNMALNSAVTAEGGEIGRAQAVQADACYLPPSILMNPILLKPNSDLGAQVIVNGKAIGNMQAKEYHRYKPELLNTVVAAHQQLQKNHRVIIVEGAGSPAEINLREHDIANMGFAEAIDCPVIIVADIDRGGVFAHLYGTYELLSESEQQRVQGFVINRFRGDVTLLEPGLLWLEEKTGVPTLAVIPYIPNLHVEAEDSLAGNQNTESDTRRYQCKVVIPVTPRASNHTDFDVLRMHPQIDCQFQKDAAQFDGADIIVLPGSKHVRGDLQWLHDSAWDTVIERHLRYGGKIIGICGGYQMLGDWVHDPDSIESAAGSTQGLGLLELETTLTGNKTLRNVCGSLLVPSKLAPNKLTSTKAPNKLATNDCHDNNIKVQVKGYEIHAGISEGPALEIPFLQLKHSDNNESAVFYDGAINADNNVIGTYVHGVFDEPEMLKYCLRWACSGSVNGLSGMEKNSFDDFNYKQYKETEINRLADVVEKVISLKSILCLLGLEE
ncbi:MAG: adenosylcobyric acid synthase [Cellvibrionaceae bacterium]|jgi:adenosylcobyric acid synthase